MTVQMTDPETLALAEAIHDEDDTCNANYAIPFAECATREYDLDLAARVLIDLRHDGWRLIRDVSTAELGL